MYYRAVVMTPGFSTTDEKPKLWPAEGQHLEVGVRSVP
jgi:hypothetical protein